MLQYRYFLAFVGYVVIQVLFGISQTSAQVREPKQTTFILIRHAEKVLNPPSNDPELSAEGQKRAEKFAVLFRNVPFSALYATPFKRTVNTAQPLAKALGMSIHHYNASTNAAENTALADSLLSKYNGGTVLIVGHSNTIPHLLNTLVGSNHYAQINDADYDNIFIVTALRRGNAVVTGLKYQP